MNNMDVPEISFSIDDEPYALDPPTARIAFKISRTLGGIGNALDRARRTDLDVYCTVLRIACPKAPKDEEGLEAFVFKHVRDIAVPLVRYLWSLENGGAVAPPAVLETGSAEGNAPTG